ncbi:tyrosine-type recombinase/integrase [Frankia sp. AgB32]|uniref:tyrosine-type recombinase/integrase n=1 Tax=Frankia sp. AgB32 TaxID=631119 RepID=UPI00200BED0C|nr:tyrosine-type recombinase/integrase [Frankia sp. AgB32]MCK9895222.1 tyrosine-type recombinase/integrase [Frankia sp. AgB32]
MNPDHDGQAHAALVPTASPSATSELVRPGDIDINDQVSLATATLIASAPAAATRRAYDRQWRLFAAWCAEQGRRAAPATDATLAEYAAALVSAGAGAASIEQAIATIRTIHRQRKLTVPDTRGARDVLRAHRRAQSDTGRRARKAPPAARDQLRAMVAACPEGPLGIRDRALLVLGVAMMGRRSELAGLDLSDVDEVDEGLLVYVRRSKTDQDAVGAEVAIPYGSHPDTCPVRAVRAWRALLTERGITDGPLLRAVDRAGRISPRRMSGDGINRIVRAAALRAGLPGADRYTAHSLRAGGATAAAKAGAQTAAIAEQGRWSLGSPVVHGYVRAVDRWGDNPMNGAL